MGMLRRNVLLRSTIECTHNATFRHFHVRAQILRSLRKGLQCDSMFDTALYDLRDQACLEIFPTDN